MTRPIYLAPLTVWGITPPQSVAVAAEAGFAGLGIKLFVGLSGVEPFPMREGSPMLKETCAALRGTGMRAWDTETLVIGPNTSVRSWEPTLASAAALGISQAVVATMTTDEQQAIDQLAQMCEMASRYGIAPSVEFCRLFPGATTLSAVRRIVEAAHPQARVLVDTLHVARSGATQAELAAIPHERLAYLQLCDAPARAPADFEGIRFEALRNRMPPGRGELPLPDMLQALPPQLPVSVEVPVSDSLMLAQARDHARLCFEATRALLASMTAPATDSEGGQ